MSEKRPQFRHLPPTAVPVKGSDLKSGLRPGSDELERFRADLAAYLDVSTEACQLASSGRSALYCLLLGLKMDFPTRTKVIMPAYTCPAVARVAIDLELKPVYVDLSLKTMDYAPGELSKALNEECLAVFIVHPFGIPLQVQETMALAQTVGAVVIEDVAQSFGAKWSDQFAGKRGEFGLFSLGPGKPMSTGGGGFVIANTPEGISTLSRGGQVLSQPGALGSLKAWARQSAFQLAFHPRGWWAATRIGLHRVGSHEASWGYQLSGLTPSQAAVGRRLLPRLGAINTQRQQKAEALQAAIANSSSLNTVKIEQEAQPIFLRFPIIAESDQQREALYEQFWANGIGAGRLYEKTLPTIFRTETKWSFPGAEAIAKRLLTLPTHHYVTGADLQTMVQVLARV